MKLTLKKLQFNEAMSEETPCFSADLYQDGKLIAYVSNRGHGGENDVRPLEGKKYDSIQHLMSIDIECDIMTLAEDGNIVKKKQSKAFVLKKDGNIYLRTIGQSSFSNLKTLLGNDYPNWLKKQRKELTEKGYEILNTNI